MNDETFMFIFDNIQWLEKIKIFLNELFIQAY